MAFRAVTRLKPKSTALFVCDLQEKFRSDICYFPEIVATAKKMVDAAKILDMKTVVAENDPKKYGHTVAKLNIDPKTPVFDKTKWSMCSLPIDQCLVDVNSVLLVGLAAHACILHTTYDLIERGIGVHVVVDAVGSRNLTDRLYGLKQLEQAGAVLTTSESALLALIGGSDHPKFREVQKLIFTSAPDVGLVPEPWKI